MLKLVDCLPSPSLFTERERRSIPAPSVRSSRSTDCDSVCRIACCVWTSARRAKISCSLNKSAVLHMSNSDMVGSSIKQKLCVRLE